jgi:DNA mismatch endonuclease (patch repair protein)
MTRSDASLHSISAPHTGKPATSSYAPWPDVPDLRRRTMSAIRSRDTKVELAVRRMLHREGYRYVVGRRVAGYRPDLLFTCRRKAIFVHGCFWHGHKACRQDRTPKTRSDYWRMKLAGNKERDARAENALRAAGWEVFTLWECEVRREPDFRQCLIAFLGPRRWG